MSSRVAVTGQMGLWILGTSVLALIACTLAWGNYEHDDGMGLTAPPIESIEKIDRVALSEPGRPDR